MSTVEVDREDFNGFLDAIALVRRDHQPDADITCKECGKDWPCPTLDNLNEVDLT